MNGTQLAALLDPGSILSGSSEAELASLAERATLQQFARGDALVDQGDMGDSWFILTKGVARVSVIAINGREITLDFLEAGAVVGEIAAIDGAERTASVIAIEHVEALRLDRAALRSAIAARPELGWRLLGQMARRLRQANATIEGDRAFASGPRLARCLVRLMATGPQGTHLRHDLNQTDLAQFAGMSREQTNRQLSAWADAGIIGREHGRVLIIEADVLLDIAESGE